MVWLSSISLLIFSLLILLLVERGTPTIIVDLSIYRFKFISVCPTYIVALFLNECPFGTDMSSWCINSLIIIQCPFLYQVVFFALKLILCYNNITTPAFFWLMFIWYFFVHPCTLNLSISLHLSWGCYRNKSLGQLKKIHSPVSFNLYI